MITEEKKQPGLKQGMLNNVMRQFDNAADLINLNPNIRKILEITNNELVVHFPVKMDNGQVEIFTGYRVQHNNALGPYKGGLRYHQGPGHVDDLENFAGRTSIWGRQGRYSA